MSWDDFVEEYDKYSLKGYLREVGGLSSGAIQAIGSFLCLEPWMEVSIVHKVVDFCHISDSMRKIRGGMDLQTKGLADKFSSDELILNSKVYEIDHDHNGVKARYDSINLSVLITENVNNE